MTYIIYSRLKNLYIRQPFGGAKTWVPELSQATQFHTEQNALNYLRKNLQLTDGEARNRKLEILSIEQAESDAEARKQAIAEANERAAAEAKEKEIRALFSASEAQMLIENLPLMVDQLLTAVDTVEKLSKYYQKSLSDTELESRDLLHKIEFSDPAVIPGFLLYTQLREVRCRRRVAKDSLVLLHLFQESGVLNAVKRLQELTTRTLRQQETRAYYPRILGDLFEAFPPVDPSGPSPAEAAGRDESASTVAQILAYEGDTATAAPPETDMEPAALPAPEAHDAPPETPEEAPALPEPVEPPRRRRTANARTWTPSALGQRRSNRHTPAPLVRRYRKA